MRSVLLLFMPVFVLLNPFCAALAINSNADSCMDYLRRGDTLNVRICIYARLSVLNRRKVSFETGDTYKVAANYFVEKSNFNKAVLYYDSAYSVAQKLDGPDRERLLAQIRFSHSMLFYRYGEYELALQLCLDAYQYYRLNHDASGIAETANRLGGLYLILGDSIKSASFSREAHQQSLKSRDERIQLTCLNAFGNYLLSLGKTDSAILIFNQAITLAQASGNSKQVSDAYYNLSYTYSNLKQYDKALQYIKEAHQWALKSNNAYDICDTRYKTGLILYYLQRFDVASDTLISALREAEKLGSKVLQRNIYDALSFLETERGNPEKALEYLKSFSEKAYMISPAVVGLIGDCYVNAGKVKEGISYFDKAAAKADNNIVSPIYLKKAGIAYENLKQYKDAIKVYTQIKEVYFASREASDIDKYIVRATELGK